MCLLGAFLRSRIFFHHIGDLDNPRVEGVVLTLERSGVNAGLAGFSIIPGVNANLAISVGPKGIMGGKSNRFKIGPTEGAVKGCNPTGSITGGVVLGGQLVLQLGNSSQEVLQMRLSDGGLAGCVFAFVCHFASHLGGRRGRSA